MPTRMKILVTAMMTVKVQRIEYMIQMYAPVNFIEDVS